MRKKRIKLGLIILLYAIIVNGVLIYGFTSYRSNLRNEATRLDHSLEFYLPDSTPVKNEQVQEDLEVEQIKALRAFYDGFYKKMERSQTASAILLISFLIESTALLWWILRNLNRK